MKYERFGRFVRDRRGRILFFLFCAAALSASFALYRLPLAAVAYPMGLAAAAGGACLLLSWQRQRRRCMRLAEILCRPASEIENLPAAICDYERALQDALCALAKRYCALERETATRQDDMADYYTLWAHQIKTPISAMRLTLHGEGGAQARRLSAQLTRIEQYVDMVLAYQRLESASTDYVFAPISLDDAVRASVRRFAGEFIDRSLKLDFRPGGAQVLTDAKWLGFMLDQLISNALKYTPSGGVTIKMEGETTLAIRDSGIGISPQDLPRIFERGYTGRNGRADQRASGIGLYLCRRIADNLGHALYAESEPGRGTVMRIDFPKREARHE